MKFIRTLKKIYPANPNGKTIVYMHAYGGKLWQATRQLRVLQREGYTILGMDFPTFLHSKNPQDLIDLMDEVSEVMEREKLISKDTIIVGVSLGGLVGFNLLRHYPVLNKLLIITGGDISHLPSNRSLRKQWKLTREELAERWKNVNMYSPAGKVKDKHMVMLLPKRDKVIDPEEVTEEISKLSKDNDIKLIRTNGGHFRTAITQTIIFPRKPLELIKYLEKF